MSSLGNGNYTLSDYFQMEQSGRHYEYRYGKIFEISHASENHHQIASNVFNILQSSAGPQGCISFLGDMRVRIADLCYVYPDIVVVCGDAERGHSNSLMNPEVIFEIISEETYDYDHVHKFEYYQKLPTITDYILVEQDRILVGHSHREADNWSRYYTTQYDQTTETLSIASIGCTLRVADIYANVKFETSLSDDHE